MHRMKNLVLAFALCVPLAACATSPDQFATNVNNVVSDTQAVTTGAVSIVADIAKALLAVTQPITSVINSIEGV
jgi:hypothetical protein